MMNSLWRRQDRLGKQSFGRGAVKPRGEWGGDNSRGFAAKNSHARKNNSASYAG